MIYIIIPIFNEEANIPNLSKELASILPGEEKYFVFSDDGSSDHSVNLLNELFSSVSYIVLGDGVNRGPGFAFNQAFEWVLKHSSNDNDLVVTMEADCTSDSNLLPKMVGISRLGFDLVLASVYAQGGGFDQTSWLRKLLSSLANLMFRFLFDIKVLTLSSFYRVYAIRLLRAIKKENGTLIKENGFICMLEILVKAITAKASIIEVPMVLFSSKRIGKSKMKTLKTMWSYFRFLLSRKLYN